MFHFDDKEVSIKLTAEHVESLVRFLIERGEEEAQINKYLTEQNSGLVTKLNDSTKELNELKEKLGLFEVELKKESEDDF